MKDRTNQRGQVLVYFGIFGLVFFSLAAVAVDVGRHVFVGREVQAAADATALVGATTLARGWDAGDAITKATTFGSENTVDGHPARSEEHTSELQSLAYLVCRLLLEKKKKKTSCEYIEHLLCVLLFE